MSGRVILRLILFALPLGLDTFALSTVLGVTQMPGRTRLRLALTFCAAEGVMPAVGLLLGLPLGNALGAASVYLAGALICAVGVWMFVKERGEDDDEDDDEDKSHAGEGEGDEVEKIARAVHTTGWALVGLALTVSLDELAVGFSFGVLGFPLVPALIVIATQALLVSLVGQWIGMPAGQRMGERAESLVGPALFLLGLWFILSQALGLAL